MGCSRRQASCFLKLCQKVLPQQLENLGNADKYRHVLATDLPHDFVWAIPMHEDRGSGNKRHEEHRDDLAKHVTQRNQA
jgi:hypothetical protein